MDPLAEKLLLRLFKAGERHHAGLRTTPPALTAAGLNEYRQLSSLAAKEAFESTINAARAEQAVNLVWDDIGSGGDFITRIQLQDLETLARFLGIVSAKRRLEVARDHLVPFLTQYAVLEDVISRWAALRLVRGTDASAYAEWLDAIRVVEFSRAEAKREIVNAPIRQVSARLFNNSKRIERLTGPLDVLLVGAVDAESRDQAQVWQELGLFREEQPVRLAGNVSLKRERVSAYLDVPYSGLPAQTVVGLATQPTLMMTIENLTTFHSEARRRHTESVLLIYTAGMPTPAWRAMYGRLLKELKPGVPIYHWGDIDEGGFRIASVLAQEASAADRRIEPWRMGPDDIPPGLRRAGEPSTLSRIQHFATAAGWAELGIAVAEAGFIIEQEALDD